MGLGYQILKNGHVFGKFRWVILTVKGILLKEEEEDMVIDFGLLWMVTVQGA